MALTTNFENQGFPGMGGFGFGSGGLLEGLLIAGLFGRNRGGLFGGGDGCGDCGNVLAGDIASKVVELQTTADIKAEVADVESGLRETLLNQTIGLNSEFRNMEGRIDKAALDAVKAQYEAKIAALEATNVLERRIDSEAEATRAQLLQFQVSTDKQFCHVDQKIANSTQQILNQLNADKLDEKNDIISQLRAERNTLNQNLVFSNQFNAVNSAIAELNQNQKMTQQTIQFGAGNTAIPTSTNNQVR